MPAAIAGVLGTAAATAAGAGAATAGLVGAGISAAGSLIGGALQSGSVDGGASKASGISQQAVTDANNNRLADRQTYQPFVDQGTGAVTQLGNVLGLNGQDAATAAMSSFQASPGFGYQVDQGLRAVDNGAAARGMLRSGATLKAEQTLGSNLADQDFGNYVNRLNTLASTGLTAANGQAGTTATYNGLLNPQTTNQAQIATGAASQDASIYGNTVGGLTSAAKTVPWNSLFGSGSSGTSGFGTGSSGGNSAGANTLQSMGLYNPLPTY